MAVVNFTLCFLQMSNLLKSSSDLCQKNDIRPLFRGELHVIFSAESNIWRQINPQSHYEGK